MIEQMAPRDAQMYWTSTKIPNDQFLLFCFRNPAWSPDTVQEQVIRRAALIADLSVRVHDVPGHLDYPYWVPRDDRAAPIVFHDTAGLAWQEARQLIAGLLTSTVDVRRCPWRLHLFPGIRGAPETGTDDAVVAVLQISHALADGRRASAIARALFGGDEPRTPPTTAHAPRCLATRGLMRFPLRFGQLMAASREGYLAYRRQLELVRSGELEPEPAGFPLISLNCEPGPARDIRLIVCPSERIRVPGVSVTVIVLTAIGAALPRYLEERGQCVPDRLGAEVTAAEPVKATVRNNFRNIGVDLCWDQRDAGSRAMLVADGIASRRRRAEHPVFTAQRAGAAVLPAPLLWAGVKAFSTDAIPPSVAGNTVVSSVARGPADLYLAGGKVVFTAGFPALSPVMGLTHGVHGIGEMVTVSVHSSPAVMPDIERYAATLSEALDEVTASLATV